ncbi:MAG: SPFH domain-containing protein, partial [Rhodospirillaceae bacterium]
MLMVEFLRDHTVAVIIAALVLFVLIRSLRIANQYERGVVFRLGKYSRTAGPGLYIVWFLVEWQNRIDLRTVTTAVEQQEAITRDNVPIKVDTVVWYRIVDPERAVIEVRAVANAVEQVSLTTLRAVLGEHSLDEILKSQDEISGLMQT